MGSDVEAPFGPAVPSVPLPRSPLSFVVAQVRFPMVASISKEDFIGPFQERIRSTYSDLRREKEMQVLVGPGGVQFEQSGEVWRFTDDKGGWEVALAPEFVALATNKYTSRADFTGRLGVLLEALGTWLNPQKVRRLGVRYINRIGKEHLGDIRRLVRAEVLGPAALDTEALAVNLVHSLAEYQYQFSDRSHLRARWGLLPAGATFDPAIDPIDSPSWVLDLDASHGEGVFEPTTIQEQVQVFTDRIYRYFRWAITKDFRATFGAVS